MRPLLRVAWHGALAGAALLGVMVAAVELFLTRREGGIVLLLILTGCGALARRPQLGPILVGAAAALLGPAPTPLLLGCWAVGIGSVSLAGFVVTLPARWHHVTAVTLPTLRERIRSATRRRLVSTEPR